MYLNSTKQSQYSMTLNSNEKSCSYKGVARWLIFECQSRSQDSGSRAQEASLFDADIRGNLALDITVHAEFVDSEYETVY